MKVAIPDVAQLAVDWMLPPPGPRRRRRREVPELAGLPAADVEKLPTLGRLSRVVPYRPRRRRETGP